MRRQKNLARRAAIAAVLYMIVGIVIAAIFSSNGIDLGVTFGIIMIAPVILYLIASGSIAEFTAPGGFGAKFRDVASAPVKTAATIESLEIVQKANQQNLISRARGLTPGKPVALRFVLNDPSTRYDSPSIEQYLQVLRKIDPDLTIIFTDPNNTFVASADGSRVEAVLSNDHYGREFVAAVKRGQIAKLEELVLASRKFVSDTTTNTDALKIMNEDGVKSLIAVDAQTRPVGVVRRDRIVSQLVASMA